MAMPDRPLDFKYHEHIKPERIHEGYCRVCRRWTSIDPADNKLRPHGPGVESYACLGAGTLALDTRSQLPKTTPTIN